LYKDLREQEGHGSFPKKYRPKITKKDGKATNAITKQIKLPIPTGNFRLLPTVSQGIN
jgi:hypothetical protein